MAPGASRDRMGRDAGRERVGRVHHGLDGLALEIGREALDTAEPADAARDVGQDRTGGPARQRQRGRDIGADRDGGAERRGFRGSAEDQEAHRLEERHVVSPSPWLTLVGIGEDGRDGLCLAAREAIAQASLVVGGERHLALLGPVAAETLAWASPMEDTFPMLLARRPEPVCVLASGDPFCFGVGAVLARAVDPAEMRCWPQPSAFSLAAARLGWALQDCALLSLCGRPLESLVPALQPGARILALSADATTPGRVAELLRSRGLGDAAFTLLEAMGGPRERRRTTTATGFDLPEIDPLNTIAIEVPTDAPCAAIVPGRPDGLFDHDGQITKSDIRAVTLARLAPRRGETLWDVGAGSGSVAIEWMLAHPANRAHAVERHPERAARIARNAAALGVPHLAVVEGRAPDSAGRTAAARRGLHRWRRDDRRCARCLPSGVEVRGEARDQRRDDRDPGLADRAVPPAWRAPVDIAVSQADPVGGFHGWRSAMPVTQWTWVKP